MKVGIYDPYLDTLSGGEKYMLSIARCLAKDNDVSIFWDKNVDEIREKSARKLDLDLKEVKFVRNIFNPDVNFVERYRDSRKFDLIIYLSDGSIPVVASSLIVHFQFPVEWVNPSLKTKLKLTKVRKVICNSKFTKSFIDKKFSINSTVLYPPIFIHGNSSKKENIILHVGRFGTLEGVNYKKQDIMIKVFKDLIDDGVDNWKFILVMGVNKGDEDKVDNLKKMIGSYSIEIIENPSNDELWGYYQSAKIYWHATGYGEDLDKHPEKAEHFGISTVEAMGAGVVPVVINSGGQREVIEGDSGFLWDSLGELKNKTLKLMNDEKLLGQMSKKAVERSVCFTGERFCRELKEIIK